MYGYLIPFHEGKSIPLTKTSQSLGTRSGKTGDRSKSYFCDFSLQENEWTLRSLGNKIQVRVNGQAIKSTKIKTGDLIAIGKLRYRLELNDEGNSSSEPKKTTTMFSRLGFGKKNQTESSAETVGPPILGVMVPSRGGKAIPLRKHRNTVGREATCDVVINDKTVSNLHCGLEFCEGHWRAVDLGSTNGIMVDGIAYQKKWLLPGEELMISLNRSRLEYQPQGNLPNDEDIPYTGRSLTDIAGIGEEETERIATRHESLEERLFGPTSRTNPEKMAEEDNFELPQVG